MHVPVGLGSVGGVVDPHHVPRSTAHHGGAVILVSPGVRVSVGTETDQDVIDPGQFQRIRAIRVVFSNRFLRPIIIGVSVPFIDETRPRITVSCVVENRLRRIGCKDVPGYLHEIGNWSG